MPDFLQIIVAAGKYVQSNRLISLPVCFENACDEGILKPAVDQQMHIAMFFMGNLDWRPAQFLPGSGDDGCELCLVILGKVFDGFMPICGFDVVAQICILAEMFIVKRQRIPETLTDSRSERIDPAPCPSTPGLDFHETERACHFQLFPQRSYTDAQFGAQFIEGGESTFDFLMRGKLAQKL